MSLVNSIGFRLKEIRKERSLNLDETAKLTGISKPMLSQIERGRSTPTITTLWKIATGLKTPISAFLQEGGSEYAVLKLEEIEPISEADGKMKVYPLFNYDPIHSAEFFYIEFEPGCEHASSKHSTGVVEYIFVTKGKFELVIGEETFVLNEGEALRFNADISHAYNNPFSDTCEAYNVIFY